MICLRVILVFTIVLLFDGLFAAEEKSHAVFREVAPSTIRPEGWLRTYLERQLSGMTGHYKVHGPPFNAQLWQSKDAGKKKSWWPYEQTAYLLDGAYKLGLLMGDQRLIRLFEDNLKWVLEHPVNGQDVLGPSLNFNASHWPNAVFFKAVISHYLETHDTTVVEAFHRHYTAIPAKTLAIGTGERHVTNIEGLLNVYAWTGDRALLEKAIEAYGIFDRTPEPWWYLRWRTLTSDRKLVIHGVTYCEELKLPVMLYMYTGDRKWLDGAEHAIAILERDHMGPSGVPSSTEYLSGKDPVQGHETCVSSDFAWTLGYFLMATGKAKYADMIERIAFNAGPGAVSKDFSGLQYLSSDNQVIATINSNHHKQNPGNSWMQYGPRKQPACCPGNVHRMMPNYVARMWLHGSDETLVAALYGASVYKGDGFVVHEETNYPWSEIVMFRFEISASAGRALSFSVRIPGWCVKPEICVNGKPWKGEASSGSFVTLKRTWRDSDTVTLSLPMELRLNRYQSALSLERGPVLYTYPVPEQARMDARATTNPTFPAVDLTPAGPWNYALALDERDFREKVHVLTAIETGNYPLDDPVGVPRLRVPVRRVRGWKLSHNGTRTPPMPVAYELEEAIEIITLVPYAQTRLRLTHFPEAITRTELPVGGWRISEAFPYDREADILAQRFAPETEPEKTVWRDVTPGQDGIVDLVKPLKKGLAYVQATIAVETEGPAILAVNVKDAAAVWFNGTLVHTVQGPNCIAYQMPDLIRVYLHKGENQVLVKVGRFGWVAEYPDGWGVRIRCVR